MCLALRATGIWKSYAAGVAGCSARVWVLRGASLSVEQGESVAILGARGAGTTTLLHCLAGLRRTDAGRVECAVPTRLIAGRASGAVGAIGEGTEALLLCDDDGDARGEALAEWLLRPGRRGRGATILATRDLSRVRHVVDRALLLRDGRLTPLDRAAGVRRVAERAAQRASMADVEHPALMPASVRAP